MKILSINEKFVLSEDKANKLYEEFDIPRLFLNSEDVITAGQLYEFIPWEVFINNDLCEIAVSNDIIDNDAVYIVSYVRKSDNWLAQSFSATTLQDALYEMVLWCGENNLLPPECYLEWDGVLNDEELLNEINRPVDTVCTPEVEYEANPTFTYVTSTDDNVNTTTTFPEIDAKGIHYTIKA